MGDCHLTGGVAGLTPFRKQPDELGQLDSSLARCRQFSFDSSQ